MKRVSLLRCTISKRVGVQLFVKFPRFMRENRTVARIYGRLRNQRNVSGADNGGKFEC